MHLSDGVLDLINEQEAILKLERTLCQSAQSAAKSAGVEDIELDVYRDIRKANVVSRNSLLKPKYV